MGGSLAPAARTYSWRSTMRTLCAYIACARDPQHAKNKISNQQVCVAAALRSSALAVAPILCERSQISILFAWNGLQIKLLSSQWSVVTTYLCKAHGGWQTRTHSCDIALPLTRLEHFCSEVLSALAVNEGEMAWLLGANKSGSLPASGSGTKTSANCPGLPRLS